MNEMCFSCRQYARSTQETQRFGIAYITCLLQSNPRAMNRLLNIEMVQTSGDLQTLDAAHDAHEFVYLLTPGYRVRIGGEVHGGLPGDMFLYPRRRAHKPLLKCDLNTRFICVQWQEEGDPFERYPTLVHDARGRVLLLLQWLWEVFPACSAVDRRLVTALWTAARVEYRRLALSTPVSFADRVRHYMARDLHRPLTLLELARSEGVSIFQLIRRFRRETGQTPGQYLQQLRVQRALNLLSTTGEPIKAIANTVGFSSPAHLAALVRRSTGRTPGSFRGTCQCQTAKMEARRQ